LFPLELVLSGLRDFGNRVVPVSVLAREHHQHQHHLHAFAKKHHKVQHVRRDKYKEILEKNEKSKIESKDEQLVQLAEGKRSFSAILQAGNLFFLNSTECKEVVKAFE
jgi:hypothetical protein